MNTFDYSIDIIDNINGNIYGRYIIIGFDDFDSHTFAISQINIYDRNDKIIDFFSNQKNKPIITVNNDNLKFIKYNDKPATINDLNILSDENFLSYNKNNYLVIEDAKNFKFKIDLLRSYNISKIVIYSSYDNKYISGLEGLNIKIQDDDKTSKDNVIINTHIFPKIKDKSYQYNFILKKQDFVIKNVYDYINYPNNNKDNIPSNKNCPKTDCPKQFCPDCPKTACPKQYCPECPKQFCRNQECPICPKQFCPNQTCPECPKQYCPKQTCPECPKNTNNFTSMIIYIVIIIIVMIIISILIYYGIKSFKNNNNNTNN